MSVAFVFPGQGSQPVGMMDGFADHPVGARDVRRSVAKRSATTCGRSSQQGPAEALNLTRNTQPVMLAAGVAVWRAWQAAGGAAPAFMAGHSLGEYTALVAAGALALRGRGAARALSRAGDAGGRAAGAGAMAAVLGADDAALPTPAAKRRRARSSSR